MAAEGYEYAGFISYAHDPDKQLAKDLHLALERVARPCYVTVLGGPDPVPVVAFDPKGRTLATAEADGTVRLWNSETDVPIGELTGATGQITALAFSPDGETLASGSADGTVRLWNALTGAPVATLLGGIAPVTVLAFNGDGVLAVGGKTGRLALWHVPAATSANLCARLGGPVSRAAWAADVPDIAFEKVC